MVISVSVSLRDLRLRDRRLYRHAQEPLNTGHECSLDCQYVYIGICVFEQSTGCCSRISLNIALWL